MISNNLHKEVLEQKYEFDMKLKNKIIFTCITSLKR